MLEKVDNLKNVVDSVTPQIHFSAPRFFLSDVTDHMRIFCAYPNDVRAKSTMIIYATMMLCTIVSKPTKIMTIFVLTYCI